MVAAAHEAEFNLVLYIFNMEGSTTWARANQRTHHSLGELVNGFANAGRCCALGAMNSQKSFHHGDRNLGGFKRNHCTVAANDLVVTQAGLQSRACAGGC